jgi:hypothetical protein
MLIQSNPKRNNGNAFKMKTATKTAMYGAYRRHGSRGRKTHKRPTADTPNAIESGTVKKYAQREQKKPNNVGDPIPRNDESSGGYRGMRTAGMASASS